MTSTTTDYRAEAASDAADMIRNFEDEILDKLIDDGEASDDLANDYDNGDSYHHERHVDKWFNLQDAAAVLDQLDEHEETDSGLWDGLAPKEAISAMAAYTYGNAVYSEWRDLIEKINSEAADILSNFEDEASDLESAIDDLKSEADDLEEEASDEDAEGNDDKAVALNGEAKAKREEAAAKQTKLDGLEEEKKEALRKMIEEATASE